MELIRSVFWHILLGNLSWGALPFVRAWRDPTISEIIGAGAGAVVVIGAVALFASDHLSAGVALSLDRVVHQPGPQEDRHHVHRARRA